jgi:hypothetical protein
MAGIALLAGRVDDPVTPVRVPVQAYAADISSDTMTLVRAKLLVRRSGEMAVIIEDQVTSTPTLCSPTLDSHSISCVLLSSHVLPYS